MRRRFLFFFVGYFLYVPGVFALLGLGVYIADKYVDTSQNPLPGWLMVVLLAVIIGGPAVWYALVWNRPSKADRQLLKTGERADASITDVSDTGISTNGGLTIYVRLTLQVRPAGREPFEANIETGVSRVSIYRPGDVVPVRYDPANPKHVVLDTTAPDTHLQPEMLNYSDIPPERTGGIASAGSLAALLQSVSASRPEVAGRLESVIEGLQHGTIKPGVVVLGGDGQPIQLHEEPGGDGLAGQLTQLDQLHRSGALSDAEYQAAKSKLLA